MSFLHFNLNSHHFGFFCDIFIQYVTTWSQQHARVDELKMKLLNFSRSPHTEKLQNSWKLSTHVILLPSQFSLVMIMAWKIQFHSQPNLSTFLMDFQFWLEDEENSLSLSHLPHSHTISHIYSSKISHITEFSRETSDFKHHQNFHENFIRLANFIVLPSRSSRRMEKENGMKSSANERKRDRMTEKMLKCLLISSALKINFWTVLKAFSDKNIEFFSPLSSNFAKAHCVHSSIRTHHTSAWWCFKMYV